MSEYKVVFRAAAQEPPNSSLITWDPGCPLVLEAIQISRHTETAQTFLQGKVRNVSADEITSFNTVVTVGFEDGSEEQVEFNPLDADIAPGSVYVLTPALLSRPDAIKAQGRVLQAKSSDEMWQASSKAGPMPEANPLNLSEKAKKERIRIYELEKTKQKSKSSTLSPIMNAYTITLTRTDSNIEEISCHDINDHGEWWVCPCGQLNVELADCLLCGDTKEIWGQIPTDNDVLEKIADERIQAEEAEKAARKAKIEAAANTAKRGGLKFLKIGIPILAALGIITVALIYWIIPTVRYQSANSLAEAAQTNEQYQEAYDAFAALGDQNDAPQRLVDLALEAGRAAEAEGDFENAVLWYDRAENIELSNAAKYAYVQANQSREDDTTLNYLLALKEGKYRDSADIYKTLFGWEFEFALVSHTDFSNKGSVWAQSSSVLSKSVKYDSPALLIMPKGGAPGSTVELDIAIEEITAKSQITYSGKWVKAGTKHVAFSWKDGELCAKESDSFSFTKMKKEFLYVSLGDNTYDEAWRATVTDTNTKEVLFTGEIRCS